MNVHKIKEQLKNKSAVEEVQPSLPVEGEQEEEEEKYWHNPGYANAIDYELTDDGSGESHKILESFNEEDINYKSAKSMSQFREFFYDMVRAYEKFENKL